MSDPTGQGPAHDPQRPDLNNELNDLVKNLEGVVRSAAQSDRARTLQRDIFGGLEQINAQFQHLTERGQQAINQAQQFVNQPAQPGGTPQSNALMQELQEMLARGVANINQQLNEFSTRIQGEAGEPGAWNVPLEEDDEEETPASGAAPGTPASSPASERTTSSPAPGGQRVSVSIEDEPEAPATGETVRLDPEKPGPGKP
jgi:ElaB/YqjD/DUF883 family membrane-anchored ribosome-binding protein